MNINKTRKKCILFCRVSSREQEETGYSLPAQESYLKEYAFHRFNIVETFSISESASGKKARKEFNQMLSYVKENNINVIVCEKVDRLTRNQKDAVTIDEWVKEDPFHEVHFVKNNFILNRESKASDKFVWNIHVSQAQFNIENLSEEVKKGQREKIAEGWYPSEPPVGYKSENAVGSKKKIIVLNPETAPLVKEVLTEYSTGIHSIQSICRFAEKIGLKNLKGNYIAKTSMHRMLQNTFYYSVFKWNNELHLGKHPPLITKDTFDSIQKHLTRKTPFRYRKHKALYSALLKCIDCNRLITWETHKGHKYGYCKGCKGKKGVKEPHVNKPILKTFDEVKVNDKNVLEAIKHGIIDYVANSSQVVSASKSQLQNDIDKYSKRLSNLYDDRADGLINSETYTEKYNEYNKKLNDLRVQQKEVNTRDEFFDIEGFKQFLDASQRYDDYYEEADDEEKRKLLKFAFNKLAYSNDNIEYDFTKAFSLLYKAVKTTNSSEIKNTDELKKCISEPDENVVVRMNNDAYKAIRSSWLGQRDSNPRPHRF